MMQAQQFPGHPVTMAQHPGMHPGHPMGPGQHPNVGHIGGQMPGGGMVQQMHPGVSGPGGPQVSQPMVTGMPPGGGTPAPGGPMPNAHAMSHLSPAHQQFLQQQQQQINYQSNPQLMHQQHQAMLARQRQQMVIQQHQQQGGGGVNMPPGAPGLNPAQLAAMRTQGMQVPMNIQQQLQAQAHNQGNQPQPNNFQQQHQMQQLAMQQAAQQNQQAQQRNSAQMQAMHEMQNATSQPQPSHTPQPQAQGTPQQQSSQPQTTGPQQHPPQPAPQQQPTPQQTPQTAQQNQQQSQQPQQQAQPQQQPQPGNPQLNPQPNVTQSNQEGQIKAQPQGPPAAMMMQQQRMQNPMRGASVLRLVQYGDQLSAFANREQSRDLGYWQNFVDKFFTKEGYLCQQLWDSASGTQKTFQIAYPALPRYYWTMFCSGIKTIQMVMETARDHDLANNGHLVSSKSSFIYWFDNDCQLVTQGSLKAQLDSNSKIESLEFFTNKHTEYIPRSLLQALAESPDMKQSPKMSKTQGKKAQQRQQQQQQQQAASTLTLPRATVSEWGVTPPVMQFLEMAETVSAMQTLFHYSQQNPHLSPAEALQQLVNSFQVNAMSMQQQVHFNPQMQQNPGQRTPGMNGPQFASPAVAHLGLPGAQGSPHVGGPTHTPSPAQNHLAGPIPMAAQLSQQGTNASGSQGTSANTSPNVTNKRRRASAVKVEGEEGGGMEVNGVGGQKVKASPRVGGKRQKGAA